MAKDTGGLTVLKEDAGGRVRVPRGRREEILDEFERSGMSGIAFAAHIGVKYQTFAGWRLRRRRAGGKTDAGSTAERPAAGRVAFVQLETPAPLEPLEVLLPGQARLVLRHRSQAALAAELLRALGSC